VTLGLTACALALQASSAAATALSQGPLVPYIVGGQKTSIEQVPWQVYVLSEFEENGSVFTASCGGSILDSTHILTAAHCTDAEGTKTEHPPEDFAVVAGDSDINFKSSTTQASGVTNIRRDPLYNLSPTSDDVAILTLSTPLELSAAKDAQAISLVPTGATPAPGTPLNISGYGKEEGAESAQPNGELFSTTLTAMSSAACLGSTGPDSAVLLCAVSVSSSTCQGDSGGPLTEGSPAVQVGIVDFGAKECPVGVPDVFTNVAAPEIRAFVEGSETPPVAARPISPPVIKAVGAAPVDFSPLTCEPGGWNGSPSFTYTFQTENAAAQVLQSGASNVFTPPASLLGVPLVCIVQATNPGGVATNLSGATPAIAADTVPPVASITALRCHLQTCTLSIAATDPNAAALGITASAGYRVTAKCPKKKGKKKKKGKQPVCHKIYTVNMPVSVVSAGVFNAAVTRLPYKERITFTAVAVNAAGLRPATSLVRSTTLHPPRPKKKKKPKKR
jgi:hypothetical protein